MKKAEATKGESDIDDKIRRMIDGEDVPLEVSDKPKTAKGAKAKDGKRPRGSLPTIKDHEKELREALKLLKEGPETEEEWRKIFNTVSRSKGWARRTYEKIRDTEKTYSELLSAEPAED